MAPRIPLAAGLSLLVAASAALLLATPPGARAFTANGHTLGLGLRDVRVFDNFADPSANDNTTPDPGFPGQLGAELALWKAVVEWGSGPHGDGAGDPTQVNLGDGGANFDAAWMGASTGQGGPGDDVVSACSACGAGIGAFTELPVGEGWRIRLCDEGILWSDGPGAIAGNEVDLQGVVCHEYGHALGLGHSTESGATMFPTIGLGQTSVRSIETDDSAGVQFVYGARSATKPTITKASAAGGALGISVEITGTGFTPTNDDVWFTPSGATNPGADPRVRVQNVTSRNGGTRITVLVPATTQAGSGDVLVKISGQGGDRLSNAFPLRFP